MHFFMLNLSAGFRFTKFTCCSWFWTRWKTRQRKEVTTKTADEDNPLTLAQFLNENGNRGTELTVGGRRCPAHEDSSGFARALTFLLKQRQPLS
jgi:hypothetical protein